MANKITVTSAGTVVNANVTPDGAMYYSNKSKEWAISNKIVDNTDYSSKYYANESKKQADISIAKTTEVIESGNTAVSNIESARDNAITDITNQETTSRNVLIDEGATQVGLIQNKGATQINLAKEQVVLATNQANIAKEQATIATNKTSEVVASGNEALSNIDTAKSSAITDITNLKNTSVSNITTAKNNAITTITTQETTSKNNVIATGNEQVERVNLTGVDNKTPIFSKSEIETNEGVYKNIYDLKRSTFDRSKFTVVGTPTITDDGIASGFSGANYLTKNNLSLSNDIIFKFRILETISTSFSYLFSSNNSTTYNDGIKLLREGTTLKLITTTSSTTNQADTILTDLKLNEYYDLEIGIKNNKITIKINNSITKEITLASNVYWNDINNSSLIIGTRRTSLGPVETVGFWHGSIDLKQFSITVDGKEVFNGNKTGLDVIKPDNYEVVGSPVISADGIATLSENNFISFPFTVQTGKITKINFKFTYSKFASVYFPFYTSNDGIIGFCLRLVFQQNGQISFSANSEPDVFTDLVAKQGDTFDIQFETDGENYTSLYIDGILKGTQNSAPTLINYMYLGSSNHIQENVSSDNQIVCDLNAFKIYVDGNLVYQPCLKIPYILSKTGSKIVDVAYRDRVIDLYEQEGQAGYYTIDEPNKNFTLPMGEIYGMIEGKADKNEVAPLKTSYIIDTYVNGTSWYRVYSDGFKEQGGQFSTGWASYKVTFPVAFTTKAYSFCSNGDCTDVEKKLDSFKATYAFGNGQGYNIITWYACGY